MAIPSEEVQDGPACLCGVYIWQFDMEVGRAQDGFRVGAIDEVAQVFLLSGPYMGVEVRDWGEEDATHY